MILCSRQRSNSGHRVRPEPPWEREGEPGRRGGRPENTLLLPPRWTQHSARLQKRRGYSSKGIKLNCIWGHCCFARK